MAEIEQRKNVQFEEGQVNGAEVRFDLGSQAQLRRCKTPYFLDDDITHCEAVLNIIKASVPSIAGLVFQMLVEVVNLVVVGHLNDPVALGGVGLGNLLINVVCFSIGMGLNGALDTLVSQAYGDKQLYLCG